MDNSQRKLGTPKLGKWELFAYGQLVVPMAVIGLPLAIYIPPFYSGTLGLDLGAVGVILMLARLSDVFVDPFIGRWSDRTHTRWGRRRPWVIVGVIIMMISAIMLFVPQGQVTNLYLLVWICAIYLGYTLIEIPYGAWGAEISDDYHERNRITGSRQIFLLIGLLIAITVPIVASQAGSGATAASAASRQAMAALGWLTAGLLPICLVILLRSVREPVKGHSVPISFAAGVRVAMRNGPLRMILATVILGALASSINAGVAVLFFEHVAQMGSSSSVLIFALFAAGVVGSPFWVSIGGRIGKHKGIGVAGFASLAAFALVPFIIYWVKPNYPGAVFPAMLVITLIQGFSIGAAPILGQSILADVVDLDTIRSGEQRTAFLFAFLAMVRKFFEAAGVGIALPVLSWIGFDPQSHANSAGANFALTAMYCLVPLALWIVSTTIIWNYPITHERQARLRAALDRRTARRARVRAAD
ncbi:MFS transporter [Parvibaculum sedimenti]|uniref:MFS transporter n=1 Tax=Parvibaculum sedimenti TaxID=2608632 RepID=A0A6N6VQL3_9HYPH|nr:MFS transporter [Parvibaculum sedimenti]KAB7741506.1 MFS transporter [Parvibaculum sedimenti]